MKDRRLIFALVGALVSTACDSGGSSASSYKNALTRHAKSVCGGGLSYEGWADLIMWSYAQHEGAAKAKYKVPFDGQKQGRFNADRDGACEALFLPNSKGSYTMVNGIQDEANNTAGGNDPQAGRKYMVKLLKKNPSDELKKVCRKVLDAYSACAKP